MGRYLIQFLEIDIGQTTHRYISAETPVDIINDYYGSKPLIKSVTDFPAEIKEKDTVTRRLKITMLDELAFKVRGTLPMASYWRMWIAQNPNYKGKIVRYKVRVEDGEPTLKFSGTIDSIQISNTGTVTIECTDLLKELSKIPYPVLTSLRLNGGLNHVWNVTAYGEMLSLSDAVNGDYAKAPFNIQLGYTSTDAVVDFNAQEYSFRFAVYKDGNCVGLTDEQTIDMTGHIGGGGETAEAITINTSTLGNIVDSNGWKILWNDGGTIKIVEQSGVSGWGGSWTIYDMNESFSTTSLPIITEEEAIYFELTADDYTDLDNWSLIVPGNIETGITGDISLLPDSGYLRIDEEIIYYSHIVDDSEGGSLTGMIRGMFGTEPVDHSDNTAIYYIICVQDPLDAFAQLKFLLQVAGIDAEYISSAFDDYEAENILDVTCLPIIKESKLAEPFFDLVNLLDAVCFQNEQGQIDILLQSERPETFVQLTDEANLIFNSFSLDLNANGRYTRWVLYWERYDIEKNMTDPDAYEKGNLTVDGTKESYYEDQILDVQYSVWLNTNDNLSEAQAIEYANTVLDSRRQRTSRAPFILSGELEIKDDTIEIGQVVKIKTGLVLTETGSQEFLQYRAVYKERRGNKIYFKFKRLYDAITPLSFADLKDWYRNCCTSGQVGPSTYQAYWQSYFFEVAQGECAMQGLQDATTERTIIGGVNPAGIVGEPSVVSLDGYAVWLVESDSIITGAWAQKSMLPNYPNRLQAKPELTMFIILAIDDGDPGNPLQALRLRGSDAYSDIIIHSTGDSPDRIGFSVRSANSYSYTLEDTEGIENDGKYYLVCVQFSLSEQKIRLIIDGRDYEYTAPPGSWDFFEFDWNIPVSPGGVVLGSNDALGAKWRGKIGEVCYFDPHILSDIDINTLANEYYLQKYPSLNWTDI